MTRRTGGVQAIPPRAAPTYEPVQLLAEQAAKKTDEPKKKEKAKKADEKSALDKALEAGLSERIEVFREVGKAIEHKEIPEVLDQLLDLTAVELEKVVEKAGFRVMDLRHNDGSRVTRVTPDFVVQLLGGVKEGRVSSLPTTPETVIKQIGELDDRAKGLLKRLEKATESSQPEIEAKLKAIQEEKRGLPPLIAPLSGLKRTHGMQQIGVVCQFNINNQDVRTRGGIFNSTFGGGVGFSTSEVDRHTGKRKTSPNANLGTHSYVGGPDFTLAKGETGPGFHTSVLGVLGGYKPLFGRYISWQPPGKPAFYLGERYIGISLYPVDWLARYLNPGTAYEKVGDQLSEKELKKRTDATGKGLSKKINRWLETPIPDPANPGQTKLRFAEDSRFRRGSLGAWNTGQVEGRAVGEDAKLKWMDRPFEIKPSIEIGIRGDPVQHIAGPILRVLFTLGENVSNFMRDVKGKSSKRERYRAYSELGEMMNKVNGRVPRAPVAPALAEEVANDADKILEAATADWLAEAK